MRLSMSILHWTPVDINCTVHRRFVNTVRNTEQLLNLYPHENIRYSYGILVGQKHDINIQSIIYRAKLSVIGHVLMTCCGLSKMLYEC